MRARWASSRAAFSHASAAWAASCSSRSSSAGDGNGAARRLARPVRRTQQQEPGQPAHRHQRHHRPEARPGQPRHLLASHVLRHPRALSEHQRRLVHPQPPHQPPILRPGQRQLRRAVAFGVRPPRRHRPVPAGILVPHRQRHPLQPEDLPELPRDHPVKLHRIDDHRQRAHELLHRPPMPLGLPRSFPAQKVHGLILAVVRTQRGSSVAYPQAMPRGERFACRAGRVARVGGR